jgi:putative DNA methylase
MKKKLIEVALPLEAINKASAREKSIRHGHPSTLHLWWARRPLAAARAVIFAQMVDDPSASPDLFPTEAKQQKERERLFRIIEDLVQWENTTNEEVLERARAEIWQSWRRACADNVDHPRAKELFDRKKLPAFHDPFAGGGALPLEAQRLGLEAYASDLNPVAVLINKAMIEIPPRFAGLPPVNPASRSQNLGFSRSSTDGAALSGADGLAEGDGSGERGLPLSADASSRRDVRNALADHQGGDLGSGEHCGGMDTRVREGEGAVPGNRAGVTGGNRDLPDPLRGDRLVSAAQDSKPPGTDRGGRQDAEHAASQASSIPLDPKSYSLFARQWKGAQGLAEDVRYYGKWMRDEAEKRIGHLYPQVEVTAEMAEGRPDLKPYVGKKLTVIAWLWARTVKSPNPAFAHVDVPLASTFMLSTKAGKEAYVEPVIEGDGYRFTVKVGKPKDVERAKRGTKSGGSHSNFLCLMSGTPMPFDFLRAESRAGRMGARLMAIVAEGERGRVYLAPTPEHEAAARKAKPEWKPDVEICHWPGRTNVVEYGLTTFGDLFTPRQLVALTTFSDLVGEAMAQVRRDALGARASGPQIPHRGWHSRGYHPHCDQPGLVQSITFRLHDSVPAELLNTWRAELELSEQVASDDPRGAELRERIARYEDAGHGACWLRDARIGKLVQDALLHFDGERYRLLEWCVMPNHVHVVIETFPGHPLSDVVRSWKTFTAREANRLLGREGAFWMPDYFDRYVRDEGHLMAVRRYIRENPVKAGLCAAAEEWPWSSAGEERAGGPRTQVDDPTPLRDGGTGAAAYAEAVGVYLAFAISKLADRGSSICTWFTERDSTRNTFARQSIPMTWDYAELNTLLGGTGSFVGAIEWTAESIDGVAARLGASFGASNQVDATSQSTSNGKVVSTDPPYYDNIGYADLSDFFYVWLRRSLRGVFPDLFATLAVPKAEELVATPYRHGSKEKAEAFFLDGMTKAMHRLAEQAHPAFPVTIYYAFKQSETLGTRAGTRASGPPDDAEQRSAHPGTASTGWETFLDAVIRAGFGISGTWPMRTELGNRMIGSGTNALASSIVLVCRQRPANARTATRREFLAALKTELPAALAHLQKSNIAPVDLAQAAIGPGMAVYTRYAKVLDAEGKPLSVREALALINQILDEVLAEQEGDFDADSRWALAWFEQHGFAEGEYGVAETLSKAKNTSVGGMVDAGILESKRGKVRLLRPDELPETWDPATDSRLTVWEMVHHLIRVLEAGGESAAAALAAKLGARAEVARELAYRLYTVSERKRRAQEALRYNALVQSWPEITRLAREAGTRKAEQANLFDDGSHR